MDALEGLIEKNDSKILLLVLDGIGGLPVDKGRTELELASTPNLDALAKDSALGMHIPVDYGITPGSGPGHLGIFGYDPLEYRIGRGILEALGLGLEVRNTDVAIRGNYATVEYVDGKPIVKDRRAGRIPTEENRRITKKIQENLREIEGVEVIVAPGMEHRTAIVLRFPEPLPEGSDEIGDTDPQEVGKVPLEPRGRNPNAQRVAEVVKKFIDKVAEILKDEPKANYLLLRGFSQKPNIPTMEERFGVRPCCIAVYPMYKGLASLVGMELIEFEGNTLKDEIDTLSKVWSEYDFFFVHVKKTDSYGEDGNWKGKVSVIEEFDRHLPEFLKLKPEVVAITGDHSTPSLLKGHSWHPVPLLIHSPYVLGGTSSRFTERECLKGELGILPAKKIINLLLANAHRLKKYGA
ncbi:2,3-bisphosphoglycerate-independent phosphoglycerate mutase [Hydrogenivirga sp. 128-5-R1-1]|uniref:2,3-bisphosphoglycerate-independent phosphoglycerate mutase n=1 Tax=Hydrogenivirga sp. 128-5-R1-1 TaxID=392423 RepID=UPI00015F168C|nr:2,3-bisphosphoglycerate-independent phosphoglycerate mutase [Hydrogenivirga sp. 128-5-R1-1]EDP74753.1 cofactor-independent phosphoglycerate mutase [Hydrogenivirga sp. 128-5-R1-1]